MKKTEKRPFLILGQNIAARRSQMGLTQEDFAHEAGIAISALKDIERGVSEGHIDTRMAIAESLGRRLSDLYRESLNDRDLFSGLSGVAEFLATLASLPPRAQMFVYALVNGDPELYSTDKLDQISSVLQGGQKAKRAKS